MINSEVTTAGKTRFQCGALDLDQILGSGRILEVEIGCGKGDFLLCLAEKFPHHFFIGVDCTERWLNRGGRYWHGMEKPPNVEFIMIDALQFIREAIPPSSVHIFHVNFPDPWPKRKHRKRRILTSDFFDLLFSRLKEEGWVHVATDSEDYFTQIKKNAQNIGLAWKEMVESFGERILYKEATTNYQRKYEAAGRPVYYLGLRKP